MATTFGGSFGFAPIIRSSNPSSFSGGFGFPKVQRTKVYYGNGLDITAARLTATSTGTVLFALGLADNPDGTNVIYEQVVSGTTFTFTQSTTGKQWLYWSAAGDPGAIVTNVTINNISD